MTYDQLNSSQSLSKAQGEQGEIFALAYERKRLPDYLHDRIVHFGEYEIARGYDILSFETKDDLTTDRCIEVKTFRGQPHFFWTDNEIVSAHNNAEHFYLYLIDYDQIQNPDYEPMIIQNPFLIFKDYLPAYYSNEKYIIPHSKQWAIQTPRHLITLLSNENIPDDWDDSIVLLGCIKDERHLKWIRSHMLYNVRTQKNVPGSIEISSNLVQKAKYLLLYSVSRPQVYFLYSIKPNPYIRNKQDMIAMDYPDPRCYSYIIHPLACPLGTFFINLAPLLRKINHTDGNTYGTPQYFSGVQLRRFMICDTQATISPTKNTNLGYDSPRNKWTQDQDDVLKEQFHRAVDFEDIATQLGHTSKEVIHRTFQIGLIKPKS